PVLVCPGEQSMVGKLYGRSTSKRISYRFSPKKEKCEPCTLRQQCHGKRKTKLFEVEKITMDSYKARMHMREKVASEEGKTRRNQRFATGEHVNGEIKDRMVIRQFHHRTKNRLETIPALIAIG